jgi:hypothetical protein
VPRPDRGQMQVVTAANMVQLQENLSAHGTPPPLPTITSKYPYETTPILAPTGTVRYGDPQPTTGTGGVTLRPGIAVPGGMPDKAPGTRGTGGPKGQTGPVGPAGPAGGAPERVSTLAPVTYPYTAPTPLAPAGNGEDDVTPIVADADEGWANNRPAVFQKGYATGDAPVTTAAPMKAAKPKDVVADCSQVLTFDGKLQAQAPAPMASTTRGVLVRVDGNVPTTLNIAYADVPALDNPEASDTVTPLPARTSRDVLVRVPDAADGATLKLTLSAGKNQDVFYLFVPAEKGKQAKTTVATTDTPNSATLTQLANASGKYVLCSEEFANTHADFSATAVRPEDALEALAYQQSATAVTCDQMVNISGW